MKKIDVSLESGDVVVCAYGVIVRISKQGKRVDDKEKQEDKVIDENIQTELNAIYEEWVRAIKAGELTPTKRPCRRFVSARCRAVVLDLTPSKMDLIINEWVSKAIVDGVLKVNPDYKQGRAKYIL
jgi:hypothetical protein